jgi:hypothetical protein
MVALAERLRLELDSSDRKNLVGSQIIPDKSGAFDGSMQHHLRTDLFKGGVYDPREAIETFGHGEEGHLESMEGRAVLACDWARLWQATSHHSQAVVATWRHSSRPAPPLAVGTDPSGTRRHLARDGFRFVAP